MKVDKHPHIYSNFNLVKAYEDANTNLKTEIPKDCAKQPKKLKNELYLIVVADALLSPTFQAA